MVKLLGPVHAVVSTVPKPGEVYYKGDFNLVGATHFGDDEPCQVRFSDETCLLADANEIVYWPTALDWESTYYVLNTPPEVKNAKTARKFLELFPADFNVDLALAMGFEEIEY